MSSDLPPAAPVLRATRSYIDESIATHAHEVAALLESAPALVRAPTANLPPLHRCESLAAIELPRGCIFVGHTATDMDSIGSAIAAAELFDGEAARASDINSETQFALDRFGVACPPPFAAIGAGKPVCLVDHNQVSQMTAGIEHKLVCGIIDHHAMQAGTLVTEVPIYVDIRPWGSACSIIAHTFVTQRRYMKPSTAGLLLCGILSDTLNLRSPTTTKADRIVVALLTQLAGVDDATALAQQLFKAKSKMLSMLTPHALVCGDNKVFAFRAANGEDERIAFGVVETTDPDGVMQHKGAVSITIPKFRLHALFLMSPSCQKPSF